MHSYVDACIWEIMISLTSEKHLCTIDNVLIDEMLQIELILKELSNKDKFKKDDLFLRCNSVKYESPPKS